MADDWSKRMFPHMGGAGEKEMRASDERERRETEEIINQDIIHNCTSTGTCLHYFNL